MAVHAPREIDLGWMIFLHRFFQDLTEQYGLPGMPNFMRTADVASATTHSPATPRGTWLLPLYAAVRHAIVMLRITGARSTSAKRSCPMTPTCVLHHQTVADMIAGTYWAKSSPPSPPRHRDDDTVTSSTSILTSSRPPDRSAPSSPGST